MAHVSGKRRTVDFLGTLLDEEVLLSLMASRLRLRVDADVDAEYPWVFDERGQPVVALHVWVWRYYAWRSLVRHLKKGEVLHHKNGKKNDARISNLGPGDRKTHAKVHLGKKQKFAKRVREDFWGMYRPHAPGPVTTISKEGLNYTPPSMTRQSLVTGTPVRSRGEQAKDAEEKLEALLERLHAELAHLDSGRRIPGKKKVGNWRDAKSRRMGFVEPRLGCTNAERSLIFLLVKFKFDVSSVASAVGIPVFVIQEMKKRSSVSVAIERWLKYRRLPLRVALPRREGRLAEKF